MSTTWEEGCLEASTAIYDLIQDDDLDYCYSPPEAIKVLRSEIAAAEIEPFGVDALGYEGMGAVATYCSTKVNCDPSTFDCLSRIENLIAAKQHDYGHGNIDRFGLLGIVVRISDKLARLENLYARTEFDDQATFESIADTWDDIVGYCIIALMVLDDTFKLPLAADVTEPLIDLERILTSARYVIDSIGNAYIIRDDGTWEYLGAYATVTCGAPVEPEWASVPFNLKGVS